LARRFASNNRAVVLTGTDAGSAGVADDSVLGAAAAAETGVRATG
jgi:hypothetical protein